jgi:peptidyl-tRNA hydrolase, PTH1 family
MGEDSPAPFLITGLGNPGQQYRGNRHNVGFMTLDFLATRLGKTFSRVEFKALVIKTEYEGQRMILAKPHTYMNLSGQAVGSLIRYYKVPLEKLMVAYDDVDLDFGMLRIRPDGGSAGQKGMASIIERLGTQDFPRLRIGVGRPPGRMDAAAYVLQDFTASEKKELDATLETATEAILTFVAQSLDTAMNRFNGPI